MYCGLQPTVAAVSWLTVWCATASGHSGQYSPILHTVLLSVDNTHTGPHRGHWGKHITHTVVRQRHIHLTKCSYTDSNRKLFSTWHSFEIIQRHSWIRQLVNMHSTMCFLAVGMSVSFQSVGWSNTLVRTEISSQVFTNTNGPQRMKHNQFVDPLICI